MSPGFCTVSAIWCTQNVHVDLRQRKHCPVPSYIRHVYISTWYTWALAVTAGVWSLPRCVIMVLVGNIGILVNMRRIYRLVWQNFPIHLLPNLNIAVIVRELLQLPILVISVPASVEPPGKRVPSPSKMFSASTGNDTRRVGSRLQVLNPAPVTKIQAEVISLRISLKARDPPSPDQPALHLPRGVPAHWRRKANIIPCLEIVGSSNLHWRRR